MRYVELKRAIYTAQTLFGGLLSYLGTVSVTAGDPAAQLSGVLLLLTGGGLILFGLLTYVLKDDADIWR